MITNPHTLEGFEKTLNDWMFDSSPEVYTVYLPNILKADIGGVLDHELPDKTHIGNVLSTMHYTFKGLRNMNCYNGCETVMANKTYKHLLQDIKELLDSDIETTVMHSMWAWIDDAIEVKAQREYAIRVTRDFNSLIAVLSQCFKIADFYDLEEKETTNDN